MALKNGSIRISQNLIQTRQVKSTDALLQDDRIKLIRRDYYQRAYQRKCQQRENCFFDHLRFW